MPSKQSGSGRKAAKKSAKKGGARPNPPTIGGGGDIGIEIDPGDPPIIVHGGGSIGLLVPPKFKEKLKKGGKFRNADQDLISLSIDGGRAIPLNVDSRIEITYGTARKRPSKKGSKY